MQLTALGTEIIVDAMHKLAQGQLLSFHPQDFAPKSSHKNPAIHTGSVSTSEPNDCPGWFSPMLNVQLVVHSCQSTP